MWSRKGSKNMARRGENIHKRKDGRWEARFLKGRINNKSIYISFYGKTYKEAKKKLTAEAGVQKCELCASRADGMPACVQGCPNRALKWEERA